MNHAQIAKICSSNSLHFFENESIFRISRRLPRMEMRLIQVNRICFHHALNQENSGMQMPLLLQIKQMNAVYCQLFIEINCIPNLFVFTEHRAVAPSITHAVQKRMADISKRDINAQMGFSMIYQVPAASQKMR